MNKTTAMKKTLLAVLCGAILVGFAVPGYGADACDPVASTVRQASKTHETVAEKMPRFKGGNAAIQEFLREEMIYPQRCIKEEKEGRTHIRCVITETGAVTKAAIDKSSGSAALDNEALRLVRIMPQWEPGMQNGKPVAVEYIIPVKFVLKDAHKRKKKASFPKGKEISDVFTDKAHDQIIVELKDGSKKGYIISETPKLRKIYTKNQKTNAVISDGTEYYEFFMRR